jgi:4-amino-4-deoxy-L-arabinose transferase-like glycosyltransferase
MDARAIESCENVPLSNAPPPALLAWLPYLWRHVLFAGGSSATTQPPRRAALLWLLFLPGVLLYPCLSFDLFEPDESRYAQIPREMLARGDWVVPVLQGEPYLDKPPLLYWLVAGCYRVFGVSGGAARLVPAVALHLCILLLYLMGRRWVGERAAFWGALCLGLAPGFLSVGRLLLLDGLLALWTTLALFAAFESLRGPRLRWGWWLVAAAACGLGVLTKGPVAVLLLAPPLLLQGWLAHDLCRVSRKALLAFVAVTAAVALPWYVALCLRLPGFAQHFLWEHNVVRFLAPFDHPRGVWFYVPVLLFGLLPGSLLLVPLARFLLSGQAGVAARRSPELGFLLLAGGWCVLFFTLSGCKLPTYILPAFPPLALALGYLIVHAGWHASRWPAAMAGAAFVLLLLGHHLVLPWYAAYRSPLRGREVLVRHCAGPDSLVVCYPRPCNAVAFHLGRSDLRHYRSKDIEELRTLVRRRPRTVILCTHRHALEGLRQLLPPEVAIVDTAHFGLASIPGVPKALMPRLARLLGGTALGLSDLAVVERRTAAGHATNSPRAAHTACGHGSKRIRTREN